MYFLILFISCFSFSVALSNSSTRFSLSLNGLWQFRLDEHNSGISDKWFNFDFSADEYIDMPVPSSFNDITVDRKLKNYVGWVWYQKTFMIPLMWVNNKHIVLRIGGAHYYTMWVNNNLAGEHEGGHVPFELDLTKSLPHDVEKCVLTIAVNNTLNNYTIPQGYLVFENDTTRYPSGYKNYYHNFDYFDYAGLNGNVEVYVTNQIYIDDVYYKLERKLKKWYVHYSILLAPTDISGVECTVRLCDKTEVFDVKTGCNNTLQILNPKLWWPIFHMNKTAGYRYKLTITLKNKKGEELDYMEELIGFRELKWDNQSLKINDENVYLRGFGMHQDSEMRGRGFDFVQLTKDINLLKWSHANAIRTSHYPYYKEFLEFADKNGIMVILETPACSLNLFDNQMFKNHKKVLKEIWSNYKHHPSIIMWSLANEPLSNNPDSEGYFKELVKFMRQIDPTRPITFVTSQQINNEKAVQHVDIISLNRYSGWYQDGSKLDIVAYQVIAELTQWNEKYLKPVLMTEYGGGSITGFHSLPSVMWSEEYQSDLLEEHFKAFDCLKTLGFFIGEMIWNFADFNTPEEYIRPGRCAKGIFTRNRQPKSAAFISRKRYASMINAKHCNCEIGLHNFITDC
ncbi:beta-glucuronidase-like isoform X2 [Cimex lectularius]|uniref:Beta-glucuronidase n=1 Tax=Cimex lectularius TaxID=79782 RepID=A0A8I6RXU1_CIMLE|nr:beta-glucuronidase-like isoform X2 [Cimex lectularius]